MRQMYEINFEDCCLLRCHLVVWYVYTDIS